MKTVTFFEIPAFDFDRAVKFYETILGLKLSVMDYDNEKMALFPADDGQCPGAVSWDSERTFLPSKNGVLIHLHITDMEKTISAIEKNGGKITRPKTKIESESRGYFALFIDSEGNRLGLYSDK
ncbi:MAG: VOC family protein [Prevotellaceae bacterium]|nr:VOC family protein [Prevotellaceae bacterium]